MELRNTESIQVSFEGRVINDRGGDIPKVQTEIKILHPHGVFDGVPEHQHNEIFETAVRERVREEYDMELGEFLGIDETQVGNGEQGMIMASVCTFEAPAHEIDSVEVDGRGRVTQSMTEEQYSAMSEDIWDNSSGNGELLEPYDATELPVDPIRRVDDVSTDGGSSESKDGGDSIVCPVEGCSELASSRDELYDHCLAKHGWWDEQFESLF